jgi:hypothetical protein
LGFPTGWLFTTHQALFLAPLPGNKEEEAPTSTTSSHVNYAPESSFSGADAGKEWKTSARGVFRTHILYFVLLFCFTLFLLASFYIKNPKKLESLVVVISLLLVHLVDP